MTQRTQLEYLDASNGPGPDGMYATCLQSFPMTL